MEHFLGLKLAKGQRIKTRVEEILSNNTLIVSYSGQLVRMMNSTQNKVKVGDALDLQVVTLEPLEFRFFQRASHFERVI